MRKITSFLSLVMLCCISVFAQEYVGSEIPANKLVKIGTAQTEVVPGQWYFIHTPRNANQSAVDFAVDGQIQSAGGLVYDLGASYKAGVSATSVIDELTSEEGVSANDILKYMIRFHAVEGLEDVYNIEYANTRWLAESLGSVSKNEAIAGQAGKFNFYLVENITDGTPNTAGRFAWSQDYMKQYIITYGAGDYWGLYCDGDGEITAENAGNSDLSLGDEGIRGDMLWQLYDIVVAGNADPYKEVFDILVEKFVEIDCLEDLQFADNLTKSMLCSEASSKTSTSVCNARNASTYSLR